MPLINHVRGEQVPDAMLNVRTPIVRLPLWMVIAWWCVKGVARMLWLACRYWYVTGPTLLLWWLYNTVGGYLLAGLVLVQVAALAAWWWWHRPSFLRWAWWPVKARCRRWWYLRRWYSAMSTARLTETFDRHTVVPVLKRVRCNGWTDTLTVRMVTGQIPDDYAKAGERLAHTFGALGVRVQPGGSPDLVVLVLRRRDALVATVPPLPVPQVPDFTALPMGRNEDGGVYTLCLLGTQVLIVGATGAGKGSVIWALVRALAGGVRARVVELWGFDPKGGMELGIGRRLFSRMAALDLAQMATMLEQAASVAQDRARRLAGKTRQHEPTVAEPLIVLIIDELANLTAYCTDRQLKDRIKTALNIVLSQGRAVGVHVVAAIQDPRKETLPARGLFPTRIALRLSEDGEVDMVLGDGSRDRGALCDRIPQTMPGVGYVVLDGDPTPTRVRFSYNTDDDIHQMERTYGPLHVVDDTDTDTDPEGRAA
jgi:hypothetical protein